MTGETLGGSVTAGHVSAHIFRLPGILCPEQDCFNVRKMSLILKHLHSTVSVNVPGANGGSITSTQHKCLQKQGQQCQGVQ